MISDVSNIYPTLQDLVSRVTGVPLADVILANQGAPSPSGLYATYNPIPIRAVGHPRHDRTLVDATEPTNLSNWEDFEDSVVSQMEFMLSVNCLNDGARDAIWKTANAQFRPTVQQFLYENDVAYRRVSEIRDLTGLDRASFQPRFQADIHVWLQAEVTVDVLRANDFKFTVEDDSGNTLASWP